MSVFRLRHEETVARNVLCHALTAFARRQLEAREGRFSLVGGGSQSEPYSSFKCHLERLWFREVVLVRGVPKVLPDLSILKTVR